MSDNPFLAPGEDVPSLGSASPWRRTPAGRGARLLAAIVDNLALALAMAPGFVVFLAVYDPSVDLEAADADVAASLSVLGAELLMGLGALLLSCWQWWQIAVSGQTVGKSLLGIRIVDAGTGEPPGFVRGVLLRTWGTDLVSGIPFVGRLIGFVDVVWIFGSESKCLHDLVAGTEVVEA